VTDPTHPLFGRRFQIVSISHPPRSPGHVTVAYREGMRLRIPVLATSLAQDDTPQPRTKYTREVLLNLLSLVKECETSCPDPPGESGNGSLKA
jgi:hypothetical protein